MVELEISGLLGQRHFQQPELGKCVGHDVPQGHFRREVPVLVEQGDTEPRLARDVALGGRELAGEQLHQRGLAGAVPTYNGPPVALGRW